MINGGSSKYGDGNEGTHGWNQRWTRYSNPHSSIVPLKWPVMDKMHSVSPCSSTPTHQMQYYESLELQRCLCALGCICIMGQELQQSTKTGLFSHQLSWDQSQVALTCIHLLPLQRRPGLMALAWVMTEGVVAVATQRLPQMMELVNLSIGNLVFQRV